MLSYLDGDHLTSYIKNIYFSILITVVFKSLSLLHQTDIFQENSWLFFGKKLLIILFRIIVEYSYKLVKI